ncbi:hypothetical protein CDAR_559291 [Caerostris darwini]|uniref:Uncharacterized protein n=1 Tax=Caerostris darwini TaxID=1538125 RepID=A0AAV4P2D7_9ARAC|nr:hypothetical protein CDAR_559291 [Caerostris darwini]
MYRAVPCELIPTTSFSAHLTPEKAGGGKKMDSPERKSGTRRKSDFTGMFLHVNRCILRSPKNHLAKTFHWMKRDQPPNRGAPGREGWMRRYCLRPFVEQNGISG